jgi:hypothetical protein
MIRPAPLLALGALLGVGLLLAAQALLPARLPAWLGGRPDPLALALGLLDAAREQPPVVVMVMACPREAVPEAASEAAPGRYTLDMAGLAPERLRWTPQENTLVIHALRPAPDAGAARCVADEDDRTAADEAAREVVRRQFLLPLVESGHSDIKVKVTFAAPPPTSSPDIPDTDAKD